MQTAKQLSVSLVNKPGRLAAMLGALNKEKVNFRALAVMDSGDRGTVRFVPDDVAAASKILEELNIRFDPAEVLLVEVPSQPGAFRNLCEKLAAEHLNIDYAYLSFNSGKGTKASVSAVFKVNDLGKAQQVLGEKNGSRAAKTSRRPGRRPVRAQRARPGAGAF
jgi:hypothetical protein